MGVPNNSAILPNDNAVLYPAPSVIEHKEIIEILEAYALDQRRYNQIGNEGWNDRKYEALQAIEAYYAGKMIEANQLLRSAYQIAKRKGVGTNWEAFATQVLNELEREHKQASHE